MIIKTNKQTNKSHETPVTPVTLHAHKQAIVQLLQHSCGIRTGIVWIPAIDRNLNNNHLCVSSKPQQQVHILRFLRLEQDYCCCYCCCCSCCWRFPRLLMVSRYSHGIIRVNLIGSSRFPGFFQNFSRLFKDFSKILQGFSRIFQRFYKDFSRIFPEFFQNFSRIFPGFSRIFSGFFPEFFQNFSRIFPGFSRIFSGFFQDFSRIFQDLSRIFSGFFRIVQGFYFPTEDAGNWKESSSPKSLRFRSGFLRIKNKS